jgi:hypothetical protein
MENLFNNIGEGSHCDCIQLLIVGMGTVQDRIGLGCIGQMIQRDSTKEPGAVEATAGSRGASASLKQYVSVAIVNTQKNAIHILTEPGAFYSKCRGYS